jgi:hypothetical protein
MKLTTHLHLVPRLRTRGDIYLLPYILSHFSSDYKRGLVIGCFQLWLYSQLTIYSSLEHALSHIGLLIFTSDLSSTGLMSIFYCLYFWDSPNLEGQVPVFISPRNRVAQLYPPALEVEVEVNLRPTVSRPVCLGVRRASGTCNQFFFLLEIFFGQLRVCYFVVPSLTRRRACNLLYNCFWALPKQSLLGRSIAELKTIFYCLIWDSPNLEGQVPVFISPRNRVAQLYPRALGSLFVASYDSQGSGGGILTHLHMRFGHWSHC